ncbi:electron transfer flavoprotein subunit alpha/FixB family protein [Azospirillum isscasi]|uniref:FAD-binding protein n=1 Tax=Azospirillum isscasi TaxID=3053926 RepID=A0ABU0WHE4_9PROT|nr:FAD-binding protein [Azospirillum isscasi]MDQ2103024.1 FAD-binding protein [Azospirillum isscasi]
MGVLLVADVNGAALGRDATARALSALAGLGDVDVLVAGDGVAAAAAEAAALQGVSKVLVADDPAYARQLAEPVADLLAVLATGYSHVAAPATASAQNILPRLAGMLDVMVLTNVIQVVDADTFARPIYAGNAVETVKSTDAVKIFTLRTAKFTAAGAGGGAEVVPVPVAAKASASSAWVEDRIAVSERPELTAAKIVVSGGRALGSKENFALIEGLADKLGAAVGASRAAVDSGFAPNDWQVGQTGKNVAPDLYVAVGISGAIQHLAGMKDSKIIVAINKDEEAPIFKVADYGLVADLFEAVPEMTGAL